jgi:hypothetical protein
MGTERREDTTTTVLAVVAGLLAGMGLGALVILVWVQTQSEDHALVADQSAAVGVQSAPAAPAPTAPAPTAPAPTAVAAPTRLERCASASAALRTPLEAAEPALEQWAVHIEAMNQLVAGEITFQQASDFWNRTRVGAQRRVDHFDAAWAEARRQHVECPSPVVAPPNPDLRPCVEEVAAQIRLLEAARTSIQTWATHVHHMDMLRMGTLSPEKATEMWLAMWQRGDEQLAAYRTAVRDERAQGGCPEPVPSGEEAHGDS